MRCSNEKEALSRAIDRFVASLAEHVSTDDGQWTVKGFLESEGHKLSQNGADYYYEVRERFNQSHDPLDFLFLNRSCFNGVMRFNRSGGFNVPFGHKPLRFSKAYITKIVNQVNYVHVLAQNCDWEFVCQDYRTTLATVERGDFVYCDPPYIGRHVDYYNSWMEDDEHGLFAALSDCPGRFILSTWHSNQHRYNEYLDSLWSKFYLLTKEHFYHVGAKEANRKPMLEALVMNYAPAKHYYEPEPTPERLLLFEKVSEYQSLTSAPV